MSTIKKGFVDVYNVLMANKESKVEDIMEQLIGLMESQQRDKNHYSDEHGLYVYCYYHKEWEFTGQVEYGSKKSTATGLNSMCKVGTNQWTKQQRDHKKAKSDLLQLVADEKVPFENLKDEMAKLEDEKDRIETLTDHYHQEGLDMEADLEMARILAAEEKKEEE